MKFRIQRSETPGKPFIFSVASPEASTSFALTELDLLDLHDAMVRFNEHHSLPIESRGRQ